MLMKKNTKLYIGSIILLAAFFGSGCYKLQTDYKYVKGELDPHINKTAKEYFLGRTDNGADTIFRWMKMGLDYAEIDLAAYEKSGRTFIFLHNNAIKSLDNNKKVNGGFFFDYPILDKDVNGNLQYNADGTVKSHPAQTWNEYSKETVKNYFLSLIIEGEYGFNNLTIKNEAVKTLLPAGTFPTKESRLGYVVTQTAPNPDPSSEGNISSVYNAATNGGFDPEGKLNLKLLNNSNSPIRINDRTDDRTAGLLATNGQIHVFDKTVHPFRYSYF